MARLGIDAARARKMTPAEIFDLVEGREEERRMFSELVAWAVYLVVMAIPSMSDHDWRRSVPTFPAFLERYPPPHYRPRRPEKKR